VNIKNIKKITINIYEINLKKYYLENETEISNEVDLSFLIPTHQEVFENSVTNPYQINKANIILEKIPNKMGMFIVDL
jgi:hypothetical protein